MKRIGLLFDLDGTLWEVTQVTYESANEVARKNNVNKVEKSVICKAFGCTKLECAKMYFPDVDIKVALSMMDKISEIKIAKLNNVGGNLYPALEESIVKLSKTYDLFIVSNTSKKEYIEAFLNTSELNKYFKDYMASGSLRND